MDGRQLTRMISAEAATYAISGLVVGCGVGILLSRFLYIKLVTRYFGISWSLPIALLGIIVVFDIASAMIAIYAPAKRIRNMAITATINDL
jgi:putative ABC transport system permease protein